jgi:uncharacterized membrane protein YkvA (DUF1232 family)
MSKNKGSKELNSKARAALDKELDNDIEALMLNPERINKILSTFPDKMSASANKIPFKIQITAAYYAIRDPKTPIRVKATLAAALAYFILPTDFFPDFIAGIGFTDDFAVLMLVLKRLGPAITKEHYQLARGRLESEQKSAK